MDAARFRLGRESERTYRLKWAAWEWRYNTAGCGCIGFEVRRRGPWGRIVDVAAVGPGNRVYVVEVKSRRADFARDNCTDADVARRIALAETPGYCSRNDDRERLRERLATISTKFHDPRFPAAADYYYIMDGANRGRAYRDVAAAVGIAGRSAVGGGSRTIAANPQRRRDDSQRAARHCAGQRGGDDAGLQGAVGCGRGGISE